MPRVHGADKTEPNRLRRVARLLSRTRGTRMFEQIIVRRRIDHLYFAFREPALKVVSFQPFRSDDDSGGVFDEPLFRPQRIPLERRRVKAERLIHRVIDLKNPGKPEVHRQGQAHRSEWGHSFIEEITRRVAKKTLVLQSRHIIIEHLVRIARRRLDPSNNPGVRASELPIKFPALGDVTPVARDDFQHVELLLLKRSDRFSYMAAVAGWRGELHARVGCQVTDALILSPDGNR